MATPPVRYVVDNTMGAALIGVTVAAALWGVSCVQTWYYYSRYQKDPWFIKSLVAAVWMFDTTHQALITHTVYTYLVTYYGQPAELGMLVWSLLVEVLFNGFTALLVQGFLTYRVWRLSNRNIFVTSATLVLVMAEFCCVLVYVGKALQFQTFAQLSTLKNLSMTVNVLAAAGDILIAAALCSLLHFSRTGFRKSDTMISKLMLFTINTGLLTSFCAVASLVSILAWGNTFIYISFFFCLGRLYSNSLLATLNARRSLRGVADDNDVSVSLQGISQKGSGRSPLTNGNARAQPNISIKIDTTKEFAHDQESGAANVEFPWVNGNEKASDSTSDTYAAV